MILFAAALIVMTPPKLAATPFPLSAVHLLGGPFEVAHKATAKYLLDLEPERLLAGFRVNSGLKPKGEIYGGWETGGLSGHSLGHYLTACAQEYARTNDPRFKAKVDAIVEGLAECQKARPDGFLMAFRFEKGFDKDRLDKIWADVAKGDIKSGGFDMNGMWSPWYVHHKVFAGLLDAQELCGNTLALSVATKFGDWAIAETKDLTDAQWQKMLGCEYGGMNESLAELYERTKQTKYLDLARKFYDNRVLDPLSEGKDDLAGKHSNTQIPKIIGLARLYETTGDTKDAKTTEFFWNAVVNHHTYAIGGNSNGEYLGPADSLADRLSSNTCETCNTYNMLKLTRHLFEWNPQAKDMDFYEQAYFNHILGSQDPASSGVTYFMPLATGSHRDYSDPFDNFTCCHGTGMENHTKHGDTVYFHDGAKTLWVNLFMPTALDWSDAKIKLRQETEFPSKNSVAISVSEGTGEFEMRLRHPGWAAGAIQYRVNGDLVATSSTPDTYASIKRTWKKGDRLEFSLPMSLREVPMPDNANRVALAYGPIVLAANMGPNKGPAPRTPVLVTDGRPVKEWLRPVAGAPLSFEVSEAARPEKLVFQPFWSLHNDRYGVYFDKFSQAEWDRTEAEYRAEEARVKDLTARTVDQVTIGEMQPERDHGLKSERNDVRDVNGRNFRTAMAGGWFSFAMKVDPAKPNVLVVTYWGNDRLRPDFAVTIDGTELAKEQLTGRPQNQFYDVEYAMPVELTRGKSSVEIRIQPTDGKSGPSVAGVRSVRAK
ncbi:glycoside hydrolase family 127 protein [soil metagenome]